MPREKQRRGEKPQWRSRAKTWVARVWEIDGACSGWTDLGTDSKELAYRIYERWLETGVPPEAKRGQEKFEVAAERIVDKHEADGDITADLAKDRRQRLRAYAIPEIGHLEVAAIEPHHVASVLDVMAQRKGKGAGTLLNMRCDISQVLAGLVREGALRVNYARGVALPKGAKVDTRERVGLTDEQILIFQKKRGFDTPLDMMVLFSRQVAGHRTSDEHAGLWQEVDLVGFAWMKVRRPKTDGDSGQHARMGRRRVRAYEKLEHEIDEQYREPIRAYWVRQGCPMSGPIFPLLRDGVVGDVKMKSGKVVRRQGGKAGEAKGPGSSYAAALRRAVWRAEIYDPIPGFDPASPDKRFCRLQTDTETTRRLDFHSLRRGLVTALADAKTELVDQLAITGHTQLSTQLKHYMGKRRVKVPRKALPGGAVEESPALPPEVLAALAVLQRAAIPVAAPQPTAILPGFGTEQAPKKHEASGNYADHLVRPGGLEPPTSGLEKRRSPDQHSQQPVKTAPVVALTSPVTWVLSQDAGQNEKPAAPPGAELGEATLRRLLELATRYHDWDSVGELSAQLKALEARRSPNVSSLDAARRRRREGDS
jgi:hypothetical protein